jgi:hypothetical protein
MKQHHFTEVEMKRYHLLQEVQNGHLTLAQAASLMGVSYRHAIRLKQRFLQQGVQGLKRRQPAQPPHQKITRSFNKPSSNCDNLSTTTSICATSKRS